MDTTNIRFLLVEDNPDHAALVKGLLARSEDFTCEVKCVDGLSKAMVHLAGGNVDMILLDLTLPDSRGLDTIRCMQEHASGLPVVVLSEDCDTAMAMRVLEFGAQDYLDKSEITSSSLSRSIAYAMKRHRLTEQLRTMSAIDKLTGVYSRSRFETLTHQQLRVANRAGRKMLLLFVDLDNLKRINDCLGHKTGDQALIDAAGILKQTFRTPDVIGRMGGDEFAVLAIDSSDTDEDTLCMRLQHNVEAHNDREHRSYELSLSVGITCYDPATPCSLDKLVERADRLMYRQKMTHRLLPRSPQPNAGPGTYQSRLKLLTSERTGIN